jgi:hypothetical protein
MLASPTIWSVGWRNIAMEWVPGFTKTYDVKTVV